MALIKCPECEREISDTVVSCPHCGYRIKEVEFVKSVPVQEKKDIGCVNIFMIVLIVVVILGIIASMARDSSSSDSESSSSESDYSSTSSSSNFVAYNYAERYVKQNLKSPSTAEFPDVFEKSEHINPISDNKYQINSWVDSQNSFGAIIRTKFSCVIVFDGDNVRCEDFKLYE